LTIFPRKYLLLDTAGKKLYERTESKTIQDFKPGQGYELGQKELEMVKLIPTNDFISGKCFFQETSKPVAPVKKSASVAKKFKPQTNSSLEVKEIEMEPTPKGAHILNPNHPKLDNSGKPIYDVYIDPKLTKVLRDYQITGVQFMYECVMGNKDYQGVGCLLADEMGLGKSVMKSFD
jgi:DNA repair and recombination protein RAD54B